MAKMTSKILSKPRILLWDLETGGVNALRSNLGMILCFGYKWLGKDETHVLTVDQYKDWFSKEQGVSDKGILRATLKIMNKADLLVAHYGDRFDRRFLQGRCSIHGFTPPPPTKQRDTWAIARRAFNFSSNRLGDIAITLGLTEQKQTKGRDAWPGWWIKALAGNREAIAEMAKYCAQDVRTLEQLYLRIRQYDYPHPRLFMDPEKCGVCGGDVVLWGFAYVGQKKYRRVLCKVCHKWDRRRRAEE